MTDRGRPALRQSADALEVGPSAMRWRDGRLVIDVDEWGAPPLVDRVRGRITVTPSAVTRVEVALDPDGRHVWRPFAPVARIDVALNRGVEWSGHGYFDANFGTAALEADFDYWTWGRFPAGDGATCFYDATRRDGSALGACVHFGPDGAARSVAPPPKAAMSRNLWLLRRETRGDAGARPRVRLPMLDAPFYSRSLVETRIDGETTVGVHEALDLRRFASPWLKPMLALRCPRRRGWPPRPGSAATPTS
jgi:carotenoid 1,2-hydratase